MSLLHLPTPARALPANCDQPLYAPKEMVRLAQHAALKTVKNQLVTICGYLAVNKMRCCELDRATFSARGHCRIAGRIR